MANSSDGLVSLICPLNYVWRVCHSRRAAFSRTTGVAPSLRVSTLPQLRQLHAMDNVKSAVGSAASKAVEAVGQAVDHPLVRATIAVGFMKFGLQKIGIKMSDEQAVASAASIAGTIYSPGLCTAYLNLSTDSADTSRRSRPRGSGCVSRERPRLAALC